MTSTCCCLFVALLAIISLSHSSGKQWTGLETRTIDADDSSCICDVSVGPHGDTAAKKDAATAEAFERAGSVALDCLNKCEIGRWKRKTTSKHPTRKSIRQKNRRKKKRRRRKLKWRRMFRAFWRWLHHEQKWSPDRSPKKQNNRKKEKDDDGNSTARVNERHRELIRDTLEQLKSYSEDSLSLE